MLHRAVVVFGVVELAERSDRTVLSVRFHGERTLVARGGPALLASVRCGSGQDAVEVDLHGSLDRDGRLWLTGGADFVASRSADAWSTVLPPLDAGTFEARLTGADGDSASVHGGLVSPRIRRSAATYRP